MSQKEPREGATPGGRPAKAPAKAGKSNDALSAETPADDHAETDQQVTATPGAAGASPAAPSNKLDELFDALIAARIWALPIVLTTATLCGYFLGVGTALLVLAGGVLLLVIALFWASVQSLTGEQDLSIDEALSLAAPSAELEQKRAVLRALKDLEFEYRIGKVSQQDYDELSARYRAEAKRLLQALADVEAAARKDAEKMLRQRLRKLDPKLAELIGRLPVVQAAPTQGAAGAITTPQAAAGADEADEADETVDAAAGEPAEDDAASEPAEGDAAGEPAEDDANTDLTHQEQEPVDDEVPRPKPVSGPSRRCPTCETRNPLNRDQCLECDAFLAKPEQTLCRCCPATYPSAEGACPVCGVPAAKDESR